MLRLRALAVLAMVWPLAACSGEDVAPGEPGEALEGIVGGKADTTSRNVVFVQIGNGGLCTGSLILPNLVLTARHCVAEIGNPEAPVNCGSSMFGPSRPASDFVITWDDNVRNGVPDDSVFEVRKTFTPMDADFCGTDVALLELTSNVPASQVTPMEPRVDSPPVEDELFDAVGFGITRPTDNSGSTAGVRMRVDDNRVGCVGARSCQGTGATSAEWAANAPVCSGDSGGPAIDSAGRVIGVTSRGDPDCTIVLYSAVSSFKSLIVDAANTASDDGGYDPPGWVTGTPTIPDGGAPMDAGAPLPDGGADGGAPVDAGADAGPPRDGGAPMDGGVRPDAGMPVMDAGTVADGGMPVSDAGAPMDAGPSPQDAGTPQGADAGTMQDAGTQAPTDAAAPTPDASRDSDDEPASNTDAGCGCRAAPARETAWSSVLVVLGLAASLRRRASGRRSQR